MLLRKPGWSESSDALGARRHGRHLTALASVAILALFATAAEAATITVNSLADPGAPGICALRDAITAANTETAVNGCIAGTGNDTIAFDVTGTITLTSTLPALVNTVTIQGPAANPPAIAVSGAELYEVMFVNPGATLKLAYLTIENGNGNIVGRGGISNSFGGTLTLTNSTFSNNTASEDGGGIVNGGKVIVTNCTFSNNIAINGGGISNSFGGTLTVTNSTFSDNTGFDDGGGINNNDGMLIVTNSTFSDNAGFDGGGGIYNGGTLTVTNSTFLGNISSDFLGGGISNGGTTANVKGTILASSISGNCDGPITDEGFNLDDDGSCGFSSGTTPDSDIALDPNRLQNNGGPTETIALESTSVAINQIPVPDCTDQSSPPVRLLTDQRGVIRPQFTACDIGAYEYDTAHSLKSNVLAAIKLASATKSANQSKLKLAGGSLYQALLLLTGDDGNSVNPALGGLEFQTEKTAVQLLAGLTPSSQLTSSTLDIWLFNITLADRTLAVVAIADAGGNAAASQLVAEGDDAVAAGYYLTALKNYANAWRLVQS